MSAEPYDTEPGPRTGADADAERHVLGSMLHGRKVLDDPDFNIEPDDFHAPRHETIAATILAMHSRGEAIDPVTVSAALLKAGDLAKVGGAPYLADLYGAPVTTANAAYYARIVRGVAMRWRGEIACAQAAQLFRSGEGDPAEIFDHARAQIDVAQRHDMARVTLVADDVDEWVEALDAEQIPGIATPWPELTSLLNGGWKSGRLYVVGARPSVGKSLMALQTALGMARHGHVGFYSLEMPRSEVIDRSVSQIGSVLLDNIERHTLSEADWEKVSRATGIFRALPLSINDDSSLTVTAIRAHARRLARKGPLAGLVVDYLQLMEASRGDQRKRHEQIGEWSRAFKNLAKELGTPVMVLSQLNREIEHRTNPEPSLADLRESGSIEQDADVVILLHPISPDEDGPDADDVGVGVAKNRQGRSGAFRVIRRGEYARLESKARPSNSTPPDDRYR